MILNRNFYKQVSFIRAWWIRRKLRKFKDEKVYFAFKLKSFYLQANELANLENVKRIPRLNVDGSDLIHWKDSRMLESICPTKALKVVEDNIMIDPKACIACGDCLEVAPKGFLGSKIKRRL